MNRNTSRPFGEISILFVLDLIQIWNGAMNLNETVGYQIS
jgi:hypothetical protein